MVAIPSPSKTPSRIGLLFACGLAWGQGYSQPPSFKFVPDTGIRIDSVAIAHADLINDTLFLFYNYHLFDGSPARGVAIAMQGSDWLAFDTAYNYFDYAHYFIRYLMPDGTYRKYRPIGRNIQSRSSPSGTAFTPDTGVRYAAQPFDSAFGVSTYIAAADGTVHLFYNTTGQGYIGCRHAISAAGDNGMHFSFAGGNVFGDSLAMQGHFYVDPNAIRNPDGSITVYLMNQHGGPYPPAGRTGYIHSFTSHDNGQTFAIDNDGAGDSVRLRFSDFDAGAGFSEPVYSLNDPKVVRLPDGRYRIYVSAMLKDSSGNTRYAIVSATSDVTSSLQQPEKTPFRICPNPFHDRYTILGPRKKTTYVVKDITGKELLVGETGKHAAAVDMTAYPPGIYFLEITSAEGRGSRKVLKILKK